MNTLAFFENLSTLANHQDKKSVLQQQDNHTQEAFLQQDEYFLKTATTIEMKLLDTNMITTTTTEMPLADAQSIIIST